ncbi:MAG TPA: bifunctional pyr operon transcriptional regulator/uracil phosphoribosyltransferase PyrR [Rubricoccaceae bacterium]|nr:bifunctional pyr operon transcriptional regulator/uracil phosphoribosyltransferase PyrR [Rubricoccaceae bacterium]
MARTQLMTPTQVRRTLDRIAHECVERNRGTGTLMVFGIRQRGVDLAHRLAEFLGAIEGAPPEVHPLDVGPFRDDRPADASPPAPYVDAPRVDGHDVLLVDDVLFTGRTARAGIDAVLQHGRPRSIQLAVLVDRGHREYPIRPDYVGRTIPTKHDERIVVEAGEEAAVYLEE